MIAALIRLNKSLTQLNLAGNNLGVAGASALAEATAANSALATVDIRFNKLDADARAAVRAVAPQQVAAGRLLVSTPDSDRGEEAAAAEGGRPSTSTKVGGSIKTLRGPKGSTVAPAGSSRAVMAGAPRAAAATVGVTRLGGGKSSKTLRR